MPVSGNEAVALARGRAEGEVLVLDEPLSFWGGVNPRTGELTDPHHPQRGENISGKVLVMPAGRGSSSSSSVLAEAIRAGTAPAAVVLREPDAILVLGALVARELYGTELPVVAAGSETYDGLATGMQVVINASERSARFEFL
jgi:uncharacterized protein